MFIEFVLRLVCTSGAEVVISPNCGHHDTRDPMPDRHSWPADPVLGLSTGVDQST
jgi:hypothetical protein